MNQRRALLALASILIIMSAACGSAAEEDVAPEGIDAWLVLLVDCGGKERIDQIERGEEHAVPEGDGLSSQSESSGAEIDPGRESVGSELHHRSVIVDHFPGEVDRLRDSDPGLSDGQSRACLGGLNGELWMNRELKDAHHQIRGQA